MISVICVYNNEKILNDYLLKSLKTQTVKYELITINNTQGGFTSAAEALNHGGEKAKGKYIMFVHQDVDLCSNTWLEEVEKVLDELPNLGIAGVAGMSEKEKKRKERIRGIVNRGNLINKPEEVQTLDECLIIIPKSVFNMLKFDEKACDDWHLYAVDYCLSAKRIGYDVYVILMHIYHKTTSSFTKNRFHAILSLGSLPNGYYQTMKKLLKKHKNHYKQIYTTCGDWSTSYPLILQRIEELAKKGVNILLRKWGNENFFD